MLSSQARPALEPAAPAASGSAGDRLAGSSDSAALTLSRAAMDRCGIRRAIPDLFAQLASAKPGAAPVRWLPIRDRNLAFRAGRPVFLQSAPDGAGDQAPSSDALFAYLGATTEDSAVPAGTEVVVVDVGSWSDNELAAALEKPASLDTSDGEPIEWLGLREIGTKLDAVEAGLFVEALALHNWHRVNRHCPRCGGTTVVEQAGWVRRCVVDNSEHYPRTDSAIICTIIDDEDRLLLGRSAAWLEGRFSTLAGFVEPGETLEAAVVREVAEEAGIVVDRPQYLGSQPWPFPCSLMLGFTAHATGTTAVPDGVEILDLRWFTRDELAAAISAGEVRMPGNISIARRLIEHWYGGELPEPDDGGSF